MRRQRPVKGGRERLPSCVLGAINREVEARAARFDASKSFIVAVILAEAFGIPHETYLAPPTRRLRVHQGGRRGAR